MENQVNCHVKIESDDVTETFETHATQSTHTLSFRSPQAETHILTSLEDGWRYQKWGEAYMDFTFSKELSEGLYQISGHTLVLTIQTLELSMDSNPKTIKYQLLDDLVPISTHTISITIDRIQEA